MLTLLLPALALAHKASDSYLRLGPEHDGRAELRWDIAVRDLDLAIGLDTDGDRLLRWGELRGQLGRIVDHLAARLTLAGADGSACTLPLAALGIEARVDGPYLALGGRYRCTGGLKTLDYRLLAGLDPTHRGLLRRGGGEGQSVRPLDPAGGPVVLAADGTTTIGAFFGQGVHHILIGYDHLLFLLCLILPAVFRRRDGEWQCAPDRLAALRSVLVTVSLFTLAHSITLALATLGLVRLPPAWVEAAIAASIVLAAGLALRGQGQRREAWLAFAFGLVHGFGFANVLVGLELPAGAFALALAGFNLGVEAGQLLVVGLALGVFFALPGRGRLAPRLMPVGALAAMGLGGVWLVERLMAAGLGS
ncbi:MAG: HupE/UreJ family protein [Rhodocyclaceae bacterium]|nr:HupE/UreJ family protein [Rhodocyclaceae bacterium]